ARFWRARRRLSTHPPRWRGASRAPPTCWRRRGGPPRRDSRSPRQPSCAIRRRAPTRYRSSPRSSAPASRGSSVPPNPRPTARERSSSRPRRYSELDGHPVPGTLEADVRQVPQRLRTQVREEEPLAAEIARASRDFGIRDVDVEPRLVRGALADEEIGATRASNELLGPGGVAGVENGAVVGFDPVAERHELRGVRHAKGTRPDTAQIARRPRPEPFEVHGEG